MAILRRLEFYIIRAFLPVAVVLICFAALSVPSDAHLGLWKPPKKFGPGGITPPNPAMPGGGLTGPNSLPLPSTTKPGARRHGTETKRPKGVTSPVDWEAWWARNRFQYLVFPNIMDRGSMFPSTPNPDETLMRINGLKRRSLTMIRPLLDDRSARLRRASLIGLARLNDHDSLPEMLKRLKDSNQTVRDAALLSLGIMENKEAKHTLLHVARGTTSACAAIKQSAVPDYFRGFAELALALDGTQGIGTILRCIAADPKASSEVKAMALEGLGLLGGDEGFKFLIDFIEDSGTSPRLIAMAVCALGKTDDAAARPCLERSLYSRHTAVRQSAALALGRIGGQGNEALLKRLYQCYRHSADQALKGFALVSIGRIGGLAAIDHLGQVLNNGTSTELPWACLGLGLALREMKDESAVDRLLHEAMTNANRSTRGAAAIALGLIKSKEARDGLIRMLQKGDDPIFRGYCALALGMIGDPHAIEPLRKAMWEVELPQVRTQATLALALLNDTKVAPELVDLLISSNNDDTKGFIALSLGFMGEVKIIDKILESIGNEELDDLTRLHLIDLVSKLLSGNPEPYLERIAEDSNFASEYPLVSHLLDFGI